MNQNFFPDRPTVAQHVPSSDDTADAFNLGAGRPAAEETEAERRQFEAWMAGHNWKCAPWDGRSYGDVFTRTTWAAWRDRGALAAQRAEPSLAGHFIEKFGNEGRWQQCKEAIPGMTRPLYNAPQPAQPVAVPHGWKLVPVEPTPAMVRAYRAKHVGGGFNEEAYRAMLAAAPTPPAAAAPVLEPLTHSEYTALAHRTCSVYKDEGAVGYTYKFLAHTLECFVRAIEAAHAAKLAKRGGV